MGKRLIAFLGLALAAAFAVAQVKAPRTYSVNGKAINYTLTVFDPPIAMRPDPSRLNQNSSVNCHLPFMRRLRESDLAGAAALTTDPEATMKEYSTYKARVGDDEFKKQMAGVFPNDQYRYELVEGREHVLIMEKQPSVGAEFIEKDGKFWKDSPKFGSESKEFNDLFTILNDHAAGKLQLK